MAVKVNHRQVSFVWATSATQNASATLSEKDAGWLKCLYVAMPSMSANVSADAHIYDAGGRKLTTIGADSFSAAGTSAVLGLNIPLEAGGIIELKLDNVPGSAAGLSATPITAYMELFTDIR